MSKIAQIQKELNELQLLITDSINKRKALTKELEDLKDKEPFIPEIDEHYYYVGGTGKIWLERYDGAELDRRLVGVGNCFRTKTKAQQYANKMLELFAENKQEDTKLTIFDENRNEFLGYLGEETNITYTDGTVVHVGDEVLVRYKGDSDEYITYVFKDNEYYKTGSIMGFAMSFVNNNYNDKFELIKLKDYSSLQEGYKYNHNTSKTYVRRVK